MSERLVKLITSDEKELEVTFKVFKQIGMFKEMLENLGMDDSAEIDPLTVPAAYAVLEKATEWMIHHQDDKEAENKEEAADQEVDEWHKKYLEIELSPLFQLVSCASFATSNVPIITQFVIPDNRRQLSPNRRSAITDNDPRGWHDEGLNFRRNRHKVWN